MPLLNPLLERTPNWEMLIRNVGWGNRDVSSFNFIGDTTY